MTLSGMLGRLRHRTVGFLLTVALGWGAWEAFVRVTAPGRIDPAVEATLRREPAVDVAVTLGFAPEDFHIRLFQTYGVVSGVRGTTVLMNRVRGEDVHRIARHYWVQRIAAR
ncbi:MAG: hypothetical protein HY727_13145 [Candidatus Rokubacteria bacterium]|nr:hypothetical protein [Candidatus Rokubacteria bacterium]